METKQLFYKKREMFIMEKVFELFVKFIWCIATLLFIPGIFYGIKRNLTIKEIFIDYWRSVFEEIKRQWKTLKESF